MPKGIILPDDTVIWIEPGDIVLSRFHGGNWFKRLPSKLITWLPGSKKHLPYSHAMMFGETVKHDRMLSAEGGRVQLVDLMRYLSPDYSIVVLRDPKLTKATRHRAALRADQLLGTRYSYWSIAAHAVDTLLSLGGRTPWTRPVASVVGRLDRKVVCSEMVAQAYWQGTGAMFRRFNSNTSVDWWACRPRDIEYTARVEQWEVIHQTSHGMVVKDEG